MTWVKENPAVDSWSSDSSNTPSWINQFLFGFLLMEDGNYLLCDTGKIRLNLLSDPDWNDEIDSGSWTKVPDNITVWV